MINEQCVCERRQCAFGLCACSIVCVMDAERQPLLGHGDVRCRRLRPLTAEEVLIAGQELTWRRTKFCIVLMFWALMAMFLSIITYILAAHRCATDYRTLELTPSVPPVHISFSPLMSRLSDPGKADDDMVYAL